MGNVAVERRLGGDVVAESLAALGASAAFGVPGVHTLAIWEGLRRLGMRSVALRTETNSALAADGYARVLHSPAPLLLTTGPGALNSLMGIVESASAHVPVLAIASQLPRDRMARRQGGLHEVPDQTASFTPLVKWAGRPTSCESLPGVIAEAWRRALEPPSGPVYVEIPYDLLDAPTDVPAATAADAAPPAPSAPSTELLDHVAELLDGAERPVIWAGGGVVRSGAWDELAAVAELLQAPVATTYMGKDAIPYDHPLAVGAMCDDGPFADLLTGSDVLLCVGTELGEWTTQQYGLRFRGRLIQIDASPERIGATFPALPVVSDAKAALAGLAQRLTRRSADEAPTERIAEIRRRIREGQAAAGHEREHAVMDALHAGLPRNAIASVDMTVAGYWAAAHLPVYERRSFLYSLGSGALGYAVAAAVGAQVAAPERPVFTIVGDGGFMYAPQELATIREHELPVKLLVIDDGGYGMLREIQDRRFGATYAVDLFRPDFGALAGAFGIPVRETSVDDLADSLEWATSVDGPAIVLLPTTLQMYRPIR
ncbi:MAG: thiamine pyrophosphate-binding protein [Solirubrobacteraceae bacterium]|nr:thiamine pyrophosphate-binding protein [Solirubrobacteraceae bacterium]